MFLRMRPDGNLGDLWYMDVTVPVVAALLALQTLCHRFKGVAIRLLFRLVHTSLAQGTQSELTPTHPPSVLAQRSGEAGVSGQNQEHTKKDIEKLRWPRACKANDNKRKHGAT